MLSYRDLPKKIEDFVTLSGVETHNLKSVDLKIPLGAVIGVCEFQEVVKPLLFSTHYIQLCKALKQNQKYETSPPQYKKLTPANLSTMISEADLESGITWPLNEVDNSNLLRAHESYQTAFASEERAKELGLGPGHFSLMYQEEGAKPVRA